MTNSEQVANFLRGRKPHAFCAQCLADALQLGSQAFGTRKDHYNPHIAHQVASALGQARRQFRRAEGLCYQCGEQRKVIRAK